MADTILEKFRITPADFHEDGTVQPSSLGIYQGQAIYPNGTTICSVDSEEHSKRLMVVGTMKDPAGNIKPSNMAIFRLPGSPRGKYSILTVFDTFQWVRTVTDPQASTASEGMQTIAAPVSGIGIANDLIDDWARSGPWAMHGTYRGIDTIANPKPTQEELDRILKIHIRYCRDLVTKADEYWGKQEFSSVVGHDEYKHALKWLGSEDREWYHESLNPISMTSCPACSEQIISTAIQCKSCGVYIPEFLADKLGRRPDEIDNPVWAALMKRASAKPR